jgi:hypothetical protein
MTGDEGARGQPPNVGDIAYSVNDLKSLPIGTLISVPGPGVLTAAIRVSNGWSVTGRTRDLTSADLFVLVPYNWVIVRLGDSTAVLVYAALGRYLKDRGLNK